jgi:nucleotide-binding universal stress UspA family protein
MSRDTNRFTRSRLRDTGRLSPAEAPDATPGGAPGRPSHLVLTNDAGRREETLLAVAGRLAERAGAAVRVAHLFDPPPGDLEVVRHLSPAYRAGPADDVCDRLFRAARSLAGRSGRPVTPELLVGPVDPTLTEYVRVNAFDLVTASSGNSWRTLWGGPWFEVARRRPVLVVGPGVSESSTAEGLPGEVLVVLDGTEGAERVLAPAAALCRLLDARLTLFRAAPSEEAGDRCHRYLLALSQFVRRGVPAVRTVVATGRTAGAVLSLQRTTGAVVALAAPVRSWLGGITPGRLGWRVLRGSTAPVLFYRPAL